MMKSPKPSVRSSAQNRALHKLFAELADELNNHGLYIGNVIRADAPWNKDRVKELIWRSTQEKITGKKSTTELTTKEVDEVFEVIQRALGELGLEVHFPSAASLIENYEE